jgi:hypothetical protein
MITLGTDITETDIWFYKKVKHINFASHYLAPYYINKLFWGRLSQRIMDYMNG